jgi:hypothetical protein
MRLLLGAVRLRLTPIGLLLAVTGRAAASRSAVLTVLVVLAVLVVLMLILTGSAVPVAVVAVGPVPVLLSALVAVGLPVFGLVRPLRT